MSLTPGSWDPAWSVHPGEIIAEELAEREWTQTYLAQLTGFTQKHVSEVINGRSGVGVEFARALGSAFGTSPELWLRLQMSYDLKK